MNHLLLDVRGLKLHAVQRGEGAPALLLHGWLDHAGSFDSLAPLLPGRTVALDFRGHGDSQWVGAGGFYHFVEYLADIDGAVELLSPGAPIRIVGHSMGAAAGLLYASLRPARVSHLTMLDAVPLSISSQEGAVIPRAIACAPYSPADQNVSGTVWSSVACVTGNDVLTHCSASATTGSSPPATWPYR